MSITRLQQKQNYTFGNKVLLNAIAWYNDTYRISTINKTNTTINMTNTTINKTNIIIMYGLVQFVVTIHLISISLNVVNIALVF